MPKRCYPVLTPFKLKGVIVKPPALVELTEAQAKEHIAGKLVDAEWAEVPTDAELAAERAAQEKAKAKESADDAGDTDKAVKPDARTASKTAKARK